LWLGAVFKPYKGKEGLMNTQLKVEQWPIERLIEYARNPRHNDDVIPQMKAAIQEFGFRIPIVAKSDGTVVDGHLRLKAAREMGLTEVPVALADELTDTQVKAFRLLANQSANWAKWDTELLKLEIEDLKLAEFDVEMIGLDLATFEAPEIEELPSPPKEQEYSEKLSIIVECASETQQEELFLELQSRGLKCRVQSL
jgi:ParB-like chromosome segregation protein Spo0J